MTTVWNRHANGTGQEIAALDTAQGILTHLIDLEEYDAVLLRLLFLRKEKKYFLRPFSLVPLAVESTQLTLCHSLIWQINPWVLVDSKRHQPLLNVNSFILKC